MNEIIYRVNRGDTLWRIANRYGTSVEQLRRSNSQAGDALQVGQVLKISRVNRPPATGRRTLEKPSSGAAPAPGGDLPECVLFGKTH